MLVARLRGEVEIIFFESNLIMLVPASAFGDAARQGSLRRLAYQRP
jgi:hypothetical protein